MGDSPAVDGRAAAASMSSARETFEDNVAQWYRAKRELDRLNAKRKVLSDHMKDIERANREYMKQNRVPSVRLSREDFMVYETKDKDKAVKKDEIQRRLAAELGIEEDRAIALWKRVTAKKPQRVESIRLERQTEVSQEARDFAERVLSPVATTSPGASSKRQRTGGEMTVEEAQLFAQSERQ